MTDTPRQRGRSGEPERPSPDPEWIRGTCPVCGASVVVNAYPVGGKGYVLMRECWLSLGEFPSCDFRALI